MKNKQKDHPFNGAFTVNFEHILSLLETQSSKSCGKLITSS